MTETIIDIEPPKQYCPYCKQELKGNKHLNEAYVWSQFNCEYNAALDTTKPLSELYIKQQALAHAKARLEKMKGDVKKLETRINQLKKDNQMSIEINGLKYFNHESYRFSGNDQHLVIVTATDIKTNMKKQYADLIHGEIDNDAIETIMRKGFNPRNLRNFLNTEVI